MIKQGICFLLLSILVVFFANYAHVLVVYIDVTYTYLNVALAPIFSSSELGVMIRKVVTLVLIPVLIVAIPAIIYRLVKRQTMPYYLETTWLLWLILVLSKVLIH